MLAFLGFEEEEVEEEPAVASQALAPAVHGQGGAIREDLPRRRAVPTLRAARPAWNGEERPAEFRSGGSGRGATVTRLVQSFPGFVVAAPRRFEESQEVADHLKAGKPVLLHLEGVEREPAQRMVNFLAGSVYALGGEMHRIGPAVLFVPAGVEVTMPLSLRIGEREGR